VISSLAESIDAIAARMVVNHIQNYSEPVQLVEIDDHALLRSGFCPNGMSTKQRAR
jgi:hypothetical protein